MTNAQWNSVINLCGVLIAGGLSAFVTYKVTARATATASTEGARQREHDSAERSKDRDHQVTLSRETFLQDRKRDAYVVIETYINYWEQFAEAHSISVTVASRFDDLPPPVIEQQAGAFANLMASEAVMAEMKEFQSKISELQLEIQTTKDFQLMVEKGTQSARPEMSQAITRARAVARAAIEIADNLHQRMRSELLTESE